jgi:DNA-binding XRE family transcriptional regulator
MVPALVAFSSQGARKMRSVYPDGNTVKKLRIKKGFTQQELAEKACRSKKTVENLEAGKPLYISTRI